MSNEHIETIHLTDYGLIKVAGVDAEKFLQGQLTCDVSNILPNQGRMGAYCNPKGRIISLFYLYLFEESFYLLLPKKIIALTINALKKYAIFFKVTLTNVTDAFMITGILGNLSSARFNAEMVFIPLTPSRQILVGKIKALEKIGEELAITTANISRDDWRCCNIKDGLPIIYPETSEKFLPHEFNLPALEAVSFKKGCYRGQEIIARIHYKGKLKKGMYEAQLFCESELKPGTEICYTEKESNISLPVGEVIECSQKQEGKYITLIVIENKYAMANHLCVKNPHEIFFNNLVKK